MTQLPNAGDGLVAALLRQRIGLDATSLGQAGVTGVVLGRMAARGIDYESAYIDLASREEREFQELLEAVVVNETWFFRDAHPYRCLQHYVRTEWLPWHAAETLRVLSLPCSTGEEAYSIAMTLLDCGLSGTRVAVDGIDISLRAITQAAAGNYGANSFRERFEEFDGLRERYCIRSGETHTVNNELRDVVKFRLGNLVDRWLLAGEPLYHIIFCRNLFIYLDASARSTAVTNLHRLLHPHGIIYVGHVEASVLADRRFAGYGNEFPFAFRHAREGLREGRESVDRGAGPATAGLQGVRSTEIAMSRGDSTVDGRPRSRKRERKAAPTVRRASSATAGRNATDVLVGSATRPDAKSPAETLAAAQNAADAGRLAEAATLCRDALERAAGLAEAHCLLAVIQQAQGDAEAAELTFQKALYLDPRHEEALMHMTLLCERRGDAR